nr:keratin-associated protein 10-6-like [Procambarus clarkii]
MKSVCLVMFLCVSLVKADSVTGSASGPAGTPPPASNGTAADGSPQDIRHHSHEFFDSDESGSHQSCLRTSACVAAGGVCQAAACNALQLTVKGGCTGSGCSCCAPRACDPKPRCKKAGGFCAPSCSAKLTVIAGGCTGTPCSCCAKKCVTTDECQDWGGVCQRGGCAPGQRELVNVCVAQGCTCCREFIRDAASNNTAGGLDEGAEADNTNDETGGEDEGGDEGEDEEEGEEE